MSKDDVVWEFMLEHTGGSSIDFLGMAGEISRLREENARLKHDSEFSGANCLRYSAERDAIAAYATELKSVLELIAAPARPDGTFNRSRDACQQLAAEALSKNQPEIVAKVRAVLDAAKNIPEWLHIENTRKANPDHPCVKLADALADLDGGKDE